MRQTVVLVDDEPNVTAALKRRMRNEPYEVLMASSAREALTLFENQRIDLIISDEQMPGMKGSELLALVNQRYPETIRMILTGHASLDSAIRAINEGEIYRFFVKPCNEVDLIFSVRHALQQKALAEENVALKQEIKQKDALLTRLERENPGISRVDTDDEGAVVIDASEV
ncbi:MAG: response regulator [Acidobacteria bacterium]|nr:response regulator [Acidobacteriota bacterium]